MPPVPGEDASPAEYAEFTWQEWEALDGYYQWWVRRWRRVLDFLRGQHWETLKKHSHEALPDWRSFPLIPYTLAFYNDYLTDYLKSDVRYSALPMSPDPQDVDAAELAEQVLKYLWDRQNMDRKRIDLGAWLIATGTGVLRIFWDTDTGNVIPLGIPQPQGGFIPVDPETFQPDPEREPEMVDAGEIGTEVISPQFVRWARSPSRGCMVGLLLTRSEVEASYGEDIADRLTYSDTHSGISSDLNQIELPGVTPRSDERALIIEHYLPPSKKHPKGLWWTSARGGKELLTGPWPIPIGRIPIVSFRWVPMPGEEHLGLSPLYGLTFENKHYEKILSKILEWYERAKPKVLLKQGGGVAIGDLTDEPFQEVPVNPGGEPEMMETQDAPQGLFRILNQIQGDVMITSGKQFAQGDSLPEGITQQSFRKPEEIQRGTETALAHINAKSAWREVGEILLRYVANFYTSQRVVAIQGPDKGFLWREFTGEDLASQDGSLSATIRVDEKSLYPWDQQNQRDTVISLLQSQAGQILFAGPDGAPDMERVEAAFQATGLDTSFDLLDPDVMEARNEQMEFRNLRQDQEPPQLQPWQEHSTHHEEHLQVVKSMRFKAWEPHQKEAFLEHIQETEKTLNQQAQEEQKQMIEMERQMRKVREDEELRADVQRAWAEEMIGLIAETAGLRVEDILEVVRNPGETQLSVDSAGSENPSGGPSQ